MEYAAILGSCQDFDAVPGDTGSGFGGYGESTDDGGETCVGGGEE